MLRQEQRAICVPEKSFYDFMTFHMFSSTEAKLQLEMMDGGMKNSRDGGWGWMIVAASFVTMICTRSVTRCVSIFFVEFQMQFSTDYSTTSWIHSLLEFTTMLCAPLGSYVGNRLSTRVAVMTGGLLSSVGLVVSSFVPSLQFLYISLGILTGLGFALSYTPAVAIVGTYFNERKALAYGITMSGRGVGIFILPPLVQYLIDLYSWRGALLTIGGLVSNLCVCGSIMRPLVGERENVKPNLDEPDVQEDLKTVKLTDIGQNEDKCDKEQEEEKSLLRCQGGQASHEGVGVKMKDSNQEEVKDKEEEHEEYSEDLMLTVTEMNLKDSKQNTNSEPTNVKDSSIESIVKESNLAKPMVAELQIADLKLHDSKLINLMVADRKQTDSKLVCSVLGSSKLADLDEQTDSKLAKSKLCVLGLPDSKLLELMPDDSKPADSEVTDSKLADSMLNDLNLAKLMLADQKLATPKLPDSQLLCETVSSKGPVFPIKQLRKRRDPECFFFPSSDKYGFLFKLDFLLLSVSFLFLAFGCSAPFVYLVPYSLSVDLSQHQAVLLMSILGGMGIVGNITFGWISDRKCLRTFRVVTFLIAVGFEGLGCLFVPLLRSFSTLMSFSVFYGFFDGAYMALVPVVTCDVVGSAHLSSALGVIGFLHAIPYLISPPIAGWLLDRSGSYTALFLLSGVSLLCSAFLLAALALLLYCCRERSVSLRNPQQA